MFESILAALKQSLPYYEREDNDDYLYIANSMDLVRAAKIINDSAMDALAILQERFGGDYEKFSDFDNISLVVDTIKKITK